jgi:hypothetical protein
LGADTSLARELLANFCARQAHRKRIRAALTEQADRARLRRSYQLIVRSYKLLAH